jgi:hypothetical protein
MKNNIWEFQAKGKGGEVVESAPGMKSFVLRGPGTLLDLVNSATILLNSRRLDAIRIGLPDPEYAIIPESIKPLGHTDHNTQEIGQWAPPVVVAPLQLPTDPAVRAAHEKLIAEKLGITMTPPPAPAPDVPAPAPVAPAKHAK